MKSSYPLPLINVKMSLLWLEPAIGRMLAGKVDKKRPAQEKLGTRNLF
jgi:hypothetical protein